MEKMPEGLGKRVIAAREKLGWSQAELARRLGTSAYGVMLLEHGQTKYPRANRLWALSRLLGVSIDYLLGLAEEEQGHA